MEPSHRDWPVAAEGGERMLNGLYARVQNQLAQLRNERGATAIEYGLLAALIAAVIIAVVAFLGENLVAVFEFIADEIGDAL
jgi:pilus assembly protein Flp/PilA